MSKEKGCKLMCILCYKKRLEMNEWFDTVAFIRNFSMEYTQ